MTKEEGPRDWCFACCIAPMPAATANTATAIYQYAGAICRHRLSPCCKGISGRSIFIRRSVSVHSECSPREMRLGCSFRLEAASGLAGYGVLTVYFQKWANAGRCWAADQHLLRSYKRFECNRDPKLSEVRCLEYRRSFTTRRAIFTTSSRSRRQFLTQHPPHGLVVASP